MSQPTQPEVPVDRPEEYTRRDKLFDDLDAQLASVKRCLHDVQVHSDYERHDVVVRMFELVSDLAGELE